MAQRTKSGYHLLMILTNVDGKVNASEDMVVRDWLTSSFPLQVNLDEEMALISELKREDYLPHFQRHMDLFYQHSTPAERLEFLQLAMNLIKADGTITREENIFFDILFEAWGSQ